MNGLPTKILVATDGSKDSALAARRAAEMAHAFGSELHMVHVVPVAQPYHLFGADEEGPNLYEEDKNWAQETLDEQVKLVEESGGKVAEAHLREGEPDAEVVSLGEEIGANMIVTGSRGLGRLRRPIGSVSSSIAAHAHCPVLVVRGGA
ncbi:MAG TPA: universal stress protein [Rubrobacter sp.]|nr:universal stress protein [Rubrobacter sp.]